jgi:hypothetical protein
MTSPRKIHVPILANILFEKQSGKTAGPQEQKRGGEQVMSESDSLFSEKDLESLEEKFLKGEGAEAAEQIYARARSRAAGEQFAAAYPEACSMENARKIANYCEEHYGDPPTFANLEKSYLALLDLGELELQSANADATPHRDTRKANPRPSASDISAGYVNLSDKEFQRLVDYDLTSDQFRRKCLDSDWFRWRVESLFTAPPVDGLNQRR